MNNQNQSSFGGFVFTIFVVFLILKLTDTIGWSWWWVTAPLWGPVAFVAAFVVLAMIWVTLSKEAKK